MEKVGGITFKLAFNMLAYEQVEAKFKSFSNAYNMLKEEKATAEDIIEIGRIMWNSWLILNGLPGNIEHEWFAARIGPAAMPALVKCIGEELSNSMHTETYYGELDESEHDVVLEEIQKKSTAGD